MLAGGDARQRSDTVDIYDTATDEWSVAELHKPAALLQLRLSDTRLLVTATPCSA